MSEREAMIAELRPPRCPLTEHEEYAFETARRAIFEQRDALEAEGSQLPLYDEMRIFFRTGLLSREDDLERLREALKDAAIHLRKASLWVHGDNRVIISNAAERAHAALPGRDETPSRREHMERLARNEAAVQAED